MAAEVAIDAGVPIVEKKYLKAKDYITFSMARFATAAISGLVQGYLLIFYTSVLGIDPLKVGTMFLIAKIWDGINDPIMGVIVDKTRSKMGKMRPYLLYGAVPFGLVIIAMFLPLGGVLSSVVRWRLCMRLICFTIFSAPWWACLSTVFPPWLPPTPRNARR